MENQAAELIIAEETSVTAAEQAKAAYKAAARRAELAKIAEDKAECTRLEKMTDKQLLGECHRTARTAKPLDGAIAYALGVVFASHIRAKERQKLVNR